jgi:hypothetical protein
MQRLQILVRISKVVHVFLLLQANSLVCARTSEVQALTVKLAKSEAEVHAAYIRATVQHTHLEVQTLLMYLN